MDDLLLGCSATFVVTSPVSLVLPSAFALTVPVVLSSGFFQALKSTMTVPGCSFGTLLLCNFIADLGRTARLAWFLQIYGMGHLTFFLLFIVVFVVVAAAAVKNINRRVVVYVYIY